LATWQHTQDHTTTEKYWERIPEGQGFPGASQNLAGEMQCTLRSHLAYTGARDLAKRSRTSLSNVVLAAYALAVAQVTGIETMVVHSMCANRFDNRWRNIVTSMSQYAAIPLTPKGDLAEHAVHVHRAAMTAYRHGMYDVDTMKPGKPTCTYN